MFLTRKKSSNNNRVCDDSFPEMSRLVSGDSPNITSSFPRKSRNEKKTILFWIQWLNPVDVFKNII